MAYTKTPDLSTYSQEEVSVFREITSRTNDPLGTKDENYQNVFVEVVRDTSMGDKRRFLYKRGGTSSYYTPSVSGDIRGSHYWDNVGLHAYCIGTAIYLRNVSSGAVTTVSGAFSTSSGTVGFDVFLYETGVTELVASDGTDLVTVSSTGTLTTSTSPDLPVPHLPKPVFMDGYIFLVEKDTANIWNSDLELPLDFTAASFITAEIKGDKILDFDKINNYLVAFGYSTMEYFWNSAEETGSPLSRNDNPVKLNGFIGGLAKEGNSLYFIGYDVDNRINLFRANNFTLEPLGNETISRYFALNTGALSSYKGYIITSNGHTFYLMNVGDRTYVYDVDTKFWNKWAYQGTNTFPITNATSITTGTSRLTVFTLSGSNAFLKFDDTVYRDNGTNFTVIITTAPEDFGSLNRKSMSRLMLDVDRTTSTSNITVQVSDDDFQTWRTIGTINLDQDLMSINKLGNFRQRAIKLTYTDNFPFRIQRILVNINKGRN